MSADKQPRLEWSQPEWRPFGDRLDMMSPEAAHAVTGKLSIIPAKKAEKP